MLNHCCYRHFAKLVGKMKDYRALLDAAYQALPNVQEKEQFRLELPKIKGGIQGNKTVITNLQQIANALRRPLDHLLKFLLRELATTCERKKGEIVFMGVFRADLLNQKIEKYIKEFVICPKCGKPDTHLQKEGSVTYLVCEACGTRTPVRTLK